MRLRSLLPGLTVFAAGLIFAQNPATLSVAGDVPMPLTLKADELASMPRQKASLPDPRGGTVAYCCATFSSAPALYWRGSFAAKRSPATSSPKRKTVIRWYSRWAKSTSSSGTTPS